MASIAAALSTISKNHPSIMQTSVETLLKIMGNIQGNPGEAKYRQLKTTNKVMSDKVLPAQGAKALLRAVGFEQPEGELVLVMQAVDAGRLDEAMGGLQRLLEEKRAREDEARAAAVAKNKVAAAKMKVSQAEERLKKQALAATIKQDQANERMDKQAAEEAKMDTARPAKMETQTLQGIYAGQAAPVRRPGSAAGMITVRVVSEDGQDNVQLPVRATFGDLRAKIAEQLEIPAERQVLALDRGCKDVVKSDRTTLAAKGIANGSLVGLKYPGFVRINKSGFQSSKPVAELHATAKGDLRAEMQKQGKTGVTLAEYERLQAERCLIVKQVKTEDAACSGVNCDREALDAFQKYAGDVLTYSCKRCALLYGTWSEDGGVEVDSLYELAQDNSGTDINITETPAQIAEVDQIAAKLGLSRVGWILFHPERAHVFTGNEVLIAATLQNEAVDKASEQLRSLEAQLETAWGPEKAPLLKQIPAAEEVTEKGKRFVTILAKPMREGNMMMVEMQPYQVSQTCMDLVAAGKFHESSSDPAKAKATKPAYFLVEGKESSKIDLEFFLVNVPLKHDHISVLASSFVQANRLDKSQQSELRTYFAARAQDDAVSTWSDFNLLVYAARSREIARGDLDQILTGVANQNGPAPDLAARVQTALVPSGGGGGHVRGGGGFGGGGGGASAMEVEPPRVNPPPAGGRWVAEASQLVNMGFDRDAALAILEATNGNVDQAMNILLDSG